MANNNYSQITEAAIITDPMVAAAEGRLDLFTAENSPLNKDEICNNVNIIAEAANNGHLEVLTWLYEFIYKTNETEQKIESQWWCDAAFRGYFDCIKFLVENGEPIHKWTIIYAAQGGQIEIVKYLETHGSEITSEVVEGAASYGHLPLLKFLYESYPNLFRAQAAEDAAGSHVDALNCLKFLYKVIPHLFSEEVLTRAIHSKNTAAEKFLLTKPEICPGIYTFTIAAKFDRVDIMHTLYEDPEIAEKVASDHNPIRWASEYNCIEAAKFLLEIGAPVTQKAPNRAAKNNNVEILKLFYNGPVTNFNERKPVVIGAECMRIATQCNSVDCIKFLFQIDVPCLDGDGAAIEADSPDELIQKLVDMGIIYLEN
ncbi:MAG: hypothetical protein CMK92_05655 [Pseudomonas sp.]|nr:hypothetical protein [Pseudomonas sp.]